MKKNFLAVVGLTVIAFFVATEIAQAADITFSGQMRTRFEYNEQGTWNNDQDDDFMQSRVRLNTNVKVNDSTSAFIQMQSARTWGNNFEGGNTTTNGGDTFGNPSGSGQGSFQGSDQDSSVGLHQAYFTLKNFMAFPADLKVGRQQIVLDGHRLFGHTGWTTGGQTHDALRLDHKHDNMGVSYAWIIANEENRTNSVDDNNDVEVHLLHGTYEGILGGRLSVIYAWVQDGCTNAAADAGAGTCGVLSNDSHTIGLRQAGQLFGIDYRGEYYHQSGSAGADGGLDTAGEAHDRDAFMFGIRLGKTFKNVSMKPSLTLWYDYLSGTDDADVTAGDYRTFDTLFDTGHKFYGLMDLYTGATSGGAGGFGLTDAAIKVKLSPMPGWTLKADYHWFNTAQGAGANNVRGANTDGLGTDLGNELDLTLINKYNANTKVVLGWSQYSATPAFNVLRIDGDKSVANWAYVMIDVKF